MNSASTKTKMTIMVILRCGNGELGHCGVEGEGKRDRGRRANSGTARYHAAWEAGALIVSPEEWEKRNRPHGQNTRTMSEFFKRSPLVGSGIDLRRSRSKAW